MTNVTPDKYRDLANELQSVAATDFGALGDTMFAAQTALRTAADQLEAVRMKAGIQAVVARALGRSDQERDWLDILAIIPPDAAPQEVTS